MNANASGSDRENRKDVSENGPIFSGETRTSAHTPGPWVSFYKHKYDEWHVSLPIEGSSMKLALCPDGIQSSNREADARLIAAAPEMLEALKAAQAALSDGGFEGLLVDSALRQIDAAISKATS